MRGANASFVASEEASVAGAKAPLLTWWTIGGISSRFVLGVTTLGVSAAAAEVRFFGVTATPFPLSRSSVFASPTFFFSFWDSD